MFHKVVFPALQTRGRTARGRVWRLQPRGASLRERERLVFDVADSDVRALGLVEATADEFDLCCAWQTPRQSRTGPRMVHGQEGLTSAKKGSLPHVSREHCVHGLPAVGVAMLGD